MPATTINLYDEALTTLRTTREHFEDGMCSPFGQWMEEYIRQYGRKGVNAIVDAILFGGKVGIINIAETMRLFGEIEDPKTYYARRRWLCLFMFYPSVRVRDGAGLGLASMDDPMTLDALRLSLKHEQSDDLKPMTQMVIDRLEKTERAGR